MVTKLKAGSFIEASVGSLWVCPHVGDAALENSFSIGIDSLADPTDITYGFILFASVTEANKGFWMVSHGTTIMKLEGKYIAKENHSNEFGNNYYKALAKISTGEIKTGWIDEDDVKHLIPHEELYEK